MEELLNQLLENPEAAKLIVPELATKIKPVLYGVVGEVWAMYKDLVNNADYYNTSAQFARNMFNAYVATGFNEDQAMELLINDRRRMNENVRNSSSKINLNNK